jgi:GTPase SAR1 family protein
MCLFTKKTTRSSSVKTLTKSTQKKAIKLIICGNASVGKTSITMRYKNGKFMKDIEPTLAGVYQEKRIKLKNGDEIQLNIWDTAGD